MCISCLDEKDWVKADYRSFASFALDIEYFERKLKKEAVEYVEEGWGPAKALMCKFNQKQFYIMCLEHAEPEYKTIIDFSYPFTGSNSFLKSIMEELNIKNESLTWKNNET